MLLVRVAALADAAFQLHTGALLYDADGTAGGAAVLFATVTPGLAVTNADFIVA